MTQSGLYLTNVSLLRAGDMEWRKASQSESVVYCHYALFSLQRLELFTSFPLESEQLFSSSSVVSVVFDFYIPNNDSSTM